MAPNHEMIHKASIAMPDIIRIKPHHLIDILTTYGAGTTSLDPHPYGHAQHIVSPQILDNPDVMLEMELGADEIWMQCAVAHFSARP